MTCHRFLTLIDALPRAEWTAAQREAIERHAGECAPCRSALAAADALEASWAGWPEPDAPPGLASSVMARIARLEDRTDTAAAQPADGRASANGLAWTNGLANGVAWSAAAAGSIIGLGAQVYALLSGSSPRDLGSWGAGAWSGLVHLSQWSSVTQFVPVGLVLYLWGFLMLLRPGGPTDRQP